MQYILDGTYPLSGKQVLVLHFGAARLSRIDTNRSMSNIKKMDNNLLMLNSRNKIRTLDCSSSTDPSSISAEDLSFFNQLLQPHIYEIPNKDLISLKKIHLDYKELDRTKDIILLIPCFSKTGDSARIRVNDQVQNIPFSYEKQKYFNLIFCLPSGTENIEICVEGRVGSLFAIRNIQIWQ